MNSMNMYEGNQVKFTNQKIPFQQLGPMVWECFSASEPVREQGIMDKKQYLGILKNNIKSSAQKPSLGNHCTF